MSVRAVILFQNAILAAVLLIPAVAFGENFSQSETNKHSGTAAPAPVLPVLTNAAQVHALTRDEAGQRRRVHIRGIVTCVIPQYNAGVVQDATSGIYIDGWNSLLGRDPRLKDMVEVEGVTDPGQFAPYVRATKITFLGVTELPVAVHPYWDQLINGSLDTQFVELEGIVTTLAEDGVTILTHGGKINVRILSVTGATNGPPPQTAEGALIRLRGSLFASWDSATHEVNVNQVRMFSPSWTIVQPAPVDAFAVPLKKVKDLFQFDPQASALRPVKVRGQILHERSGQYYAVDGANGFRFVAADRVPHKVGEIVEVVGFPNLTGPSPVLYEAMVRKTGAGTLPQPRAIDATSLFRAENDATRVRVKAVLLSLSGDGRRLELQSGLQRFVAYFDGSGVSDSLHSQATGLNGPDLPPGSRIELTGVFSGSGGNRATDTDVANFELLLNSRDDIRVIMRPPFWTLQRMLVLVGALLGVLGLALFWIQLLQHKVQQRTAQLRKEVHERERAEHQRALAQERARIARDLHDDLGSSLTEITMLATSNPGAKLPAEESAERMQTIAGKSRTLVYALDEIVWAVDPERDTVASVARYLASYAEEYLAGLKVVCRVRIPNSFPERVVSGEMRHHLFLAVKETLNNAVKHGGATEIGFQVSWLQDAMRIAVSDNGPGFDVSGRFAGRGLLNMRSRLENLGGSCEITSSAETGTSVSLVLPLPARNGSNGHL
jgi:signal transduction histidine kinase